MRIDIKKLVNLGYHVESSKDSIEIYPVDGKSAVEMLQKEFQLAPMYAYDLDEKIHNYQIMTIICE